MFGTHDPLLLLASGAVAGHRAAVIACMQSCLFLVSGKIAEWGQASTNVLVYTF